MGAAATGRWFLSAHADSVSQHELTRALFAVPGVASVQSATAVTDSFREAPAFGTGAVALTPLTTVRRLGVDGHPGHLARRGAGRVPA